jgi:endoglucanase
MKVGRRRFIASTAALAAASQAFGVGAAAAAPGPYPSYNTSPIPPEPSGVTHTAVEIASRIKLGWNAGNTMEAIGGETAWGNPLITQAPGTSTPTKRPPRSPPPGSIA